MAHYTSSRSRARTRRSTKRRSNGSHPFVAFLLVASFGILFAGCGKPAEIPQAEEFTFTAEDLAKVKELIGNGTGAFVPRLELQPENEGDGGPPVLDIGSIQKFNAMRQATETDQDLYRVTNIYLNVRSEPRVTAPQLGSFNQSQTVEVIEFVDAAWAKIVYEDSESGEGYVSARYISKLLSEQQLEEQQKKYEGLYFVDFGFLNVRKAPDTNSEKIGRLEGRSFVRPITMDDIWARIPFEDGDGYVAVQYLSPFLPNFLVRQSNFNLPVVHFRLSGEGVLDAMPAQLDALRQAGLNMITMRELYQLLLKQEERDVRSKPGSVIVAVSEVTPENLKEVSDILRASAMDATLFIESKHLGIGGIEQRNILTLLANGHDLQSAGHTGDDLRSLTDAQVELELGQSKQLLEKMTKKKVYALAYPLGGVNDRIARKAGEVGYLLGVSSATDVRFDRTQLLRMPSITVKASTTPAELVTTVKGEQ